MLRKPKLILFDVGGVLMHFYHIRDQVAAHLGVNADELGALLNELEIGRSNGTISEVEVEARIKRHFSLNLPPGFWSDLEWVNNFQPISVVHQLVQDLVGHYQLGVLSNVTREVYEKGRSIPGLWPNIVFNPMILSFEAKLAKPDPKIFKYAVKLAGSEPGEVLFIDDVEKNTQAAESVGLQTFLFNPADAERDAERLRVFLLSDE